MVKHIIVVSDNSRDNITIYTEEPAFIAMAERGDLNALRTLDEANKAGIYILMGEEKRYIGQATNIYKRLSSHHKQKDWWNQVIFFGREDGHLDKSQLDYLESLLIQEFRQTTFLVINGTEGNSSWIDKTKKIQADKIWNITQNILTEVANIDIFENNQFGTEDEKEIGDYFIQLPNSHKIYGKNPSNNYVEFFKYLLTTSPYSQMVKERVISGKTNSKFLLGTEPRFDKKSKYLSTELESNIHLLTTLSTADKKRVLLRFAQQIDLPITIHWD